MNLLSQLSRFGHDLSSKLSCLPYFLELLFMATLFPDDPFIFYGASSHDVVKVVTCQLSVVDAGEAPLFSEEM